MYKQGSALNNIQWLICHKTQPAIARLEFELDYYDVAIQHVRHYTTGTPTKRAEAKNKNHCILELSVTP